MNLNPVSDEALIQRYYGCENTAFDQLCDRHWRRLYKRISRILGRPNDAADLVEETLMKAMRTKDQFTTQFRSEHQTKFSAWLNKIAINCIRDFLRKQKPEMSFSDIRRESDEGGEFGPEDWLISETGGGEVNLVMKIDLYNCIARLNEEEKRYIELHMRGEKLEEIAKILNYNVARVFRLKWRTFTKLGKCLSERIS